MEDEQDHNTMTRREQIFFILGMALTLKQFQEGGSLAEVVANANTVMTILTHESPVSQEEFNAFRNEVLKAIGIYEWLPTHPSTLEDKGN
jgi:hypothetical protein